MASKKDLPYENEYKKVPHQAGAAHDEGAIARMNLRNDNVSVVHSGESDPMPNQEAQEAYYDEVLVSNADASSPENEANPTNHNHGADSITAMDRDEEIDVADVDELSTAPETDQPENPTDTSPAPSSQEGDENEFEYQQHMAEDGGPADEEMLAQEERAS